MEKNSSESEKAYNNGKKGILYPKSHSDYEINKIAYIGYRLMVVSPILDKNIEDLLR